MSTPTISLMRTEAQAFSANVQAGAPIDLPIIKSVTPYDRFKRTYRNNFCAFTHDCFTWKENEQPTAYQDDILESIPVKKRVAVRGPHGLGKTAMASWVVLCFALTRDGEDWKCPTTASAWRQLTKYLWPEIHKWSRRLRWDVIGRKPFDVRSELLQINLKLDTGEAFALASDNHELIEGAHADSLLYLFDESKAIPDATFDAAEGAFMGAGSDTSGIEAYALAISTPGEPVGRFYDIHKRKPGLEDWYVRHVTLDEAIKAGRISLEKAEQRKRQWGEKSALYQNRVLGEFCASDEDGIIPISWIEQSNERWNIWNEAGRPGVMRTLGGDIARSGEDKNVLAPCYEVIDLPGVKRAIGELRRESQADTMQTTGQIANILRANPGCQGIIDVIGIGAGVVDRLREQEFSIVAFNASEHTDAKDSSGELGFLNKRSAAWWNVRELLDPSNGHEFAIPPDDMLTGDLTAPHWREISSGKIQVEGKDDGWMDKDGNKRPPLRQRLGRSTDDGDSVVQAVWHENKLEGHVSVPEAQTELNAMATIFAKANANGNGHSNGQF